MRIVAVKWAKNISFLKLALYNKNVALYNLALSLILIEEYNRANLVIKINKPTTNGTLLYIKKMAVEEDIDIMLNVIEEYAEKVLEQNK